jgi:AraC-like DNA-binding protein
MLTLTTYLEHRPPQSLEPVIACAWESAPAQDHLQRVVPDGCVDLIWLADRELVIAGADSGPREVVLAANARSTAIRIRPGSAGAFLGMPASELRDRQVPAAAVWGEEVMGLEEALAGADPVGRLDLLVNIVTAREVQPDTLVYAAAHALARPTARVAEVAAELGVSERGLRRRVLAAVGYGPKTLARVVRLRRLIAVGDEPLASRAFAAGYASQAHMNDEVRRLTGTTPVRFLKDAMLTAA